MSAYDDFYVGYLPVPPQLKRRVTILVFTLVIAIIGGGVLIATLQSDPGDGQWDLDHITEFAGALEFKPYPVLTVQSKSLLIVNDGKFGAESRLAGLDRHQVTLKGHTIRRGELMLFELDAENPIVKSEPSSTTSQSPISVGDKLLEGEFIDPKCYSGAMKPGLGKTHKACAILCLRGGIPPTFLDRNGNIYLVTSPDGSALRGDSLETIIPFVGDMTSARGEIARVGDLLQFRVDASSIKRL